MNQIHGRFQIANDDFLYVLSTFIFEPIRWNERFGWRPLCDHERQAYFRFWSEVGRRMNIKEIPADFTAYEQFNVDYERQHFRYTEANDRVGAATRELFVMWFPRLFAPLVRWSIYALLDDPLREAFRFPRPPRLVGWIVPAALRLRAGLLKFSPASRVPALRSELRRPTYPDGHKIEEIGPVG